MNRETTEPQVKPSTMQRWVNTQDATDRWIEAQLVLFRNWLETAEALKDSK